MPKQEIVTPKFTELNELASKINGGKILFATDDWFAQAENLLTPEEAVFKPDLYTDCGKWMDGWETRRRRCPGHDWCIIKLGIPGVIHGIDLDTAFFTGNYAPRFSLQAANLNDEDEQFIPEREKDMIGTASTKEMFEKMRKLNSKGWEELIHMSDLQPGYEETRHNYFHVDSNKVWTHLRLNIYPDGGIARLRVFGEAFCDENVKDTSEIVDLVALQNGGVCKGYSNAHYGHPRNLIRPGQGVNMGDGWETARRLDRPAILETDPYGILQVPGNEWAVFRLGYIGSVNYIEVDTKHFKGNFPDSVKIEGTLMKPTREWNNRAIAQCDWHTILPASKLSADRVHHFDDHDIRKTGPFSHVRVTIAPDGGISRLRIYGNIIAPFPR
ncbi:hypothetical protein ILUMI_04224 [Ignelater luminosus]|uniref:Allantoate amidinohydrolase n=1 Tax=Ignelater luminosus TaxID=2038154 RepID=A0A8K0GJ82_IGNLU|nr:hypothetical protein ILUMI_04224 [Ignelater luminosus]